MAARCGCGSLQRTMFEALCVSFLTQLDTKSHARVSEMIVQAVLGKDAKSILSQPLPEADVPCVQVFFLLCLYFILHIYMYYFFTTIPCLVLLLLYIISCNSLICSVITLAYKIAHASKKFYN